MVSPQKEDGFVAVANEIWDALSQVKLSQNEWQVLRLVLRMSYGCGKKVCFVEAWADFDYCAGVHKSSVRDVLVSLETKRILAVDWYFKAIAFNKDYETWLVQKHSRFRDDRYASLLRKNLQRSEIANTVSKKLMVLVKNYKQKANTVSNLLTRCSLFTNNVVSNLLTSTPSNTSDTNGSQPPKDSLKTIKDNSSSNNNRVASPKDEIPQGISQEVKALRKLIFDKFKPQITQEPPYAATNTAYKKHGYDKLREAIDRCGMVLKNQTPGGALAYVVSFAENPDWGAPAKSYAETVGDQVAKMLDLDEEGM